MENNIFGARLKALREERNMTQGELAERIGISRVSVVNYESGNRIPDIHVLQRLKNLFDVDYEYFFGELKNTDNDLSAKMTLINELFVAIDPSFSVEDLIQCIEKTILDEAQIEVSSMLENIAIIRNAEYSPLGEALLELGKMYSNALLSSIKEYTKDYIKSLELLMYISILHFSFITHSKDGSWKWNCNDDEYYKSAAEMIKKDIRESMNAIEHFHSMGIYRLLSEIFDTEIKKINVFEELKKYNKAGEEDS